MIDADHKELKIAVGLEILITSRIELKSDCSSSNTKIRRRTCRSVRITQRVLMGIDTRWWRATLFLFVPETDARMSLIPQAGVFVELDERLPSEFLVVAAERWGIPLKSHTHRRLRYRRASNCICKRDLHSQSRYDKDDPHDTIMNYAYFDKLMMTFRVRQMLSLVW